MSTPPSDSILPGVLIVAVLLPVMYGVARVGAAVLAAWSAYRLAPLASMVAGHVDRGSGCLVGTYGGWPVKVYLEPQRSVGLLPTQPTVTQRMNPFCIAVPDLAGGADWRLQFHVTGLLGHGGRELGLPMSDGPLRQRLVEAGVVADVSAVSSPTLSYVTVQYEKGTRTLTYTDDVSPSRVPTRARFAEYLALVARLAALNASVNAPGAV